MQLEGLSEVSEGQEWGGGAQNLQCIKGFLTFICLPDLFFMSNIISRDMVIKRASSDFSITLNKASIVVCEP